MILVLPKKLTMICMIKVVDKIMANTVRQEDCRLEMPLPWRSEARHLLGTYFKLADSIHYSNLKKLRSN